MKKPPTPPKRPPGRPPTLGTTIRQSVSLTPEQIAKAIRLSPTKDNISAGIRAAIDQAKEPKP